MSSGPATPPTPDYAGSAAATAAGNKENTVAAQQGSMVDQFTPYGSLTYQSRGATEQGNPVYSANYNLNSAGQQLLNNLNNTQLGLSGLQQGAENRVAGTFSQPMDQSSVQQTADQAYKNYTARLDPQWQHNEDMQKTALANQGMVAGGEGYDNAMRDFNNSRNDAYTQANTAAINTMPQTYQLAAAQRNQPLNELNALMTGSQVTNPQFSAQPGQQAAPGANFLGAAQAQGQYDQGLYNSQVGQANSFNSGLATVAGAAATFF